MAASSSRAGEQLCLATIDGFGTLLGETVFTSMDDYVTTNPRKTPAWQARLAENRLGETKPSVPVLQSTASNCQEPNSC